MEVEGRDILRLAKSKANLSCLRSRDLYKATAFVRFNHTVPIDTQIAGPTTDSDRDKPVHRRVHNVVKDHFLDFSLRHLNHPLSISFPNLWINFAMAAPTLLLKPRRRWSVASLSHAAAVLLLPAPPFANCLYNLYPKTPTTVAVIIYVKAAEKMLPLEAAIIRVTIPSPPL